MVDPAETAPARFERDDIELVKLFLGEYKDSDGNSYYLKVRPDIVERNAKAVEAVAVDERGHRLAIEHTLLLPFEGKKADDVPFLTVFGPLRRDRSLLVPNRFIWVQCPALSISKGKGIDWNDVGQKVLNWFRVARETFPADGESRYAIPDVGFELTVTVETMDRPGSDGAVVVSRILPYDKPFIDVLRRSLHSKVPKLVKTPADKHILLLEDEGFSIRVDRLVQGINSSIGELAALKELDEVWVVYTVDWKISGDVLFCSVWPGGVGERFPIPDKRFSGQKALENGLAGN